jgi:hypothetical protein
MVRRPRPTTSTVTDDGDLVPWLAASGPLAYTPEQPPKTDYYFQYGWVLPGILGDGVNKRRHFYFGEQGKEHAEQLFAFWRAARQRAATRIALLLGSRAEDSVIAPVAAYAARLRFKQLAFVLMQHGSYQILGVDQQPLLDAGEVVLYRGIEKADTFRFLRVGETNPESEVGRIWRRYMRTQAHVMSDSTLSFNSVHDRTKRSETWHIRDGTWLTDDIAADHGLDLTSDGFAKELWRTTHQSFTLAQWVAEQKFGPHYVKCKTPISNIRLTTFFAGEHEVRIVDPDRLEFLECVGCRVREIAPDDIG